MRAAAQLRGGEDHRRVDAHDVARERLGETHHAPADLRGERVGPGTAQRRSGGWNHVRCASSESRAASTLAAPSTTSPKLRGVPTAR